MARWKATLGVTVLATVCAAATATLVWNINAMAAWGNHADLTGGSGSNGALDLIFLAAISCMATSVVLIVVITVLQLNRPSDIGQAQGGGSHTNKLSVMSFGLGAGQVLLPVLGAIGTITAGHMAIHQISRRGGGGRKLALAGLIIGYSGIMLPALFLGAFVLSVP